MPRTIRIHVNKNRILQNLKTEREGLERAIEPVCRLETYKERLYGTRINVCCKECGSEVMSLISKWDGGKRLDCGATVYLETDTTRATAEVLWEGALVGRVGENGND